MNGAIQGEHPSTEQLQRHYDGELPHREAAELRLHLADCPHCKAYLSGLERLGQFVKMAVADVSAAAPEPDFARMFDAISAATVTESAIDLKALPNTSLVSDLGANKSEFEQAIQMELSERRAAQGAARASSAPKQTRWLSRHTWNRGAPALGAVALAAAALLIVYKQATVPGETNEAASYEAMATTGHSEIVAVDFGSNAGQVFDIPMSDGSTTPVVWIDDDDDEEEE